MITKVEPTYWVKIYSSGPIEAAKQVIREECLRQGLCVTVEPTTYIYTGGEETGFVIGLVNYPRFPTTPTLLMQRAEALALIVLKACAQHSILIQSPDETKWITIRGV